MSQFKSNYQGSQKTFEKVKEEIRQRWGSDEAEKYDPFSNCLTFHVWSTNGYKVKKGEKSIRSIVIVEKKDDQGQVIKSWPKKIHLFYQTQVEKSSNS